MSIFTKAPPPAAGVSPPANINGTSDQWIGVRGTSGSGTGVVGQSSTGDGVFGESGSGVAIHGKGSKAGQFDGAVAINGVLSAYESLNLKGDLNAGSAINVSGDIHALGNVVVSGDVTFTGGDCAEDMDAVLDIDPGSVVVIDDSGKLRECNSDYDKRVLGVVSGAGDLKPAMILGKKQGTFNHKAPLALSGKVYCKVDAEYSPIEVGDLLTTSSTPGHAMRATDPARSFGCVVGKAMARLDSGYGLVPVLVALQ
ncbi:MAG: hypothetical protein JRN15_23305 [Nitrososphaerota archaeon]|nr:hypothetical protein [Nitrososphaerota archaeon]